jgi:hypothetical protein
MEAKLVMALWFNRLKTQPFSTLRLTLYQGHKFLWGYGTKHPCTQSAAAGLALTEGLSHKK